MIEIIWKTNVFERRELAMRMNYDSFWYILLWNSGIATKSPMPPTPKLRQIRQMRKATEIIRKTCVFERRELAMRMNYGSFWYVLLCYSGIATRSPMPVCSGMVWYVLVQYDMVWNSVVGAMMASLSGCWCITMPFTWTKYLELRSNGGKHNNNQQYASEQIIVEITTNSI